MWAERAFHSAAGACSFRLAPLMTKCVSASIVWRLFGDDGVVTVVTGGRGSYPQAGSDHTDGQDERPRNLNR